MTLTRRQRDALKVALEVLGNEERFFSNSPSREFKAKTAEYYHGIVDAMQTIEEMLRGVQGELPLDYHGEGVA